LKFRFPDPKINPEIPEHEVEMDPFKHLRSRLEQRIVRAWESLTEGWREVLSRSSGALTHFAVPGKSTEEQASHQNFPHWARLAGEETWETARSVIIRVEIPGMNKDDLDISIEGNVLRIRGENAPRANIRAAYTTSGARLRVLRADYSVPPRYRRRASRSILPRRRSHRDLAKDRSDSAAASDCVVKRDDARLVFSRALYSLKLASYCRDDITPGMTYGYG
jgi:hypothetical protein